MQEMRRKQEETRQRELEERRRKEAEAKRKRLEEAEKKRLVMQEAIKRRDDEAKRNFFLPRRTADAAQSGPMIVGMRDVMKTKEQLAEDKRIAMKYRLKPLNISDDLRTAEIKKIVNDLWSNIVQLESDKYDLEEEQRRQEYHLKELMERQKQINKNKALKMGLDIEDLSTNVPPKVRLASKYERKVDRRSFTEKTSLFDGGYVENIQKTRERQWADKVNQFKEGHADKTVPKWDPSAPRKDTYEPGTVIYEESDEEDADLVDKLRGYVEEANKERRNSQQQLQQEQNRQQDILTRRRSSQMSQMSQSSQASKTGAQQVQRQQSAQQQSAASRQQQQHHEDEGEDEEEYEEEEEYTDEEIEE